MPMMAWIVEPLLGWIFRFLDVVFFGLSTKKRIDRALDEVDKALAYSTTSRNRAKVEHLYRLFDALDQKAGALLTHISILIAGLLVIYGRDGWLHVNRVLEAEIIAYLILTFPCLRSIRMSSPWYDRNREELRDDIDRLKFEYWKRKRYLNSANAMTIVVTVCVIVTLFQFRKAL